MAGLSRGTTVISEEALPVFGYTWFKVEPGDFIDPGGCAALQRVPTPI